MKKLENDILQGFLERLIEELKEENDERSICCEEKDKINIPFIVSSLYQSFDENADKYEDFIQDLCLYPDYNFCFLGSQSYYNGILDVEINLVNYHGEANEQYYTQGDSPNYNYKICFTYDQRDYRYCQCTPDMPDYREDKHCCGHGCDATFCAFSLHKVLNILSHSWNGDSHDYWEFEDEFYLSDKALADKKREEDKSREIAELKNIIEDSQKRLDELVANTKIDEFTRE